MRTVRDALDVATAVATVAAYLVASLALVEWHRRGGVVRAPDDAALGLATLVDQWPFLVMAGLAIGMGAGLIVLGARQPAVGLGWPKSFLSRSMGVGDDRSAAYGANTVAPRVEQQRQMARGHDRWDAVVMIAAIGALIIASLTLVRVVVDDGGPPSIDTAIPQVVAPSDGPTEAKGTDQAAGGAIVVRADLGEFFIDFSPVDVPAGEVLVEVVNTGVAVHNLVLVDGGSRTIDLAADQSTRLDLGTLSPGAYVFICDIPGHQQAGMEASLTVTGT